MVENETASTEPCIDTSSATPWFLQLLESHARIRTEAEADPDNGLALDAPGAASGLPLGSNAAEIEATVVESAAAVGGASLCHIDSPALEDLNGGVGPTQELSDRSLNIRGEGGNATHETPSIQAGDEQRARTTVGEGMMIVGSLVEFEQGDNVPGYSPSVRPATQPGHSDTITPPAANSQLANVLVPLSAVLCFLSVGAASAGWQA